jgi:hypothetical protein
MERCNKDAKKKHQTSMHIERRNQLNKDAKKKHQTSMHIERRNQLDMKNQTGLATFLSS